MNPGRLNRRARLEKPTTTRGSHGSQREGWELVKSFWVGVRPLRGENLFKARQENALVTHAVDARYRKDVKPGMRLMVSDQELLVRHPIDVGDRRRWLEIICEEVIT